MSNPSLLCVPYRFKTSTLYSQIPDSGLGDFTVTRSASNAATRVNAQGFIETVADNVPRLDYPLGGITAGCPALLVEPSAQNLVLHSRDLTNAVWSGSNVTTAKNAVGADGVASGATTLTATAASGTVLQALSHASQSRIFSAYVRRVSGSGAIQMTTNGGTNWTTVTISSLYTQVACAAQTVASGTVGFRMAVSGDVIEVDFTQGEVGPVFTSPIPTTTAAVTRNADVVSVSGTVSGAIGQTEGTIYCEFVNTLVASYTESYVYRVFADANNEIWARKEGGGNTYSFRWRANSQNTTFLNVAVPNGVSKIAFGYKSGDTALFLNGSQVATTNTDVRAFSVNPTTIALGSTSSGQFFNDRIRSAALYTTRLTNDQLAALTTL